MPDTVQEGKPEHPFVPGARVALVNGYYEKDYAERFVGKLHKSGRFTLRDDASNQQWRASTMYRYGRDEPVRWHAHKTGDSSYRRDSLLLWDAHTDAEIREAMAAQARRLRLNKLQKRIERLRYDDVTDEVLDVIERALPVNAESRS